MRRNIILLSICQALSISGSTLVITVTALTGKWLAPMPSLVTLPITFQFVATMLSTIPASLLMARIGRRAGFTFGQLIGITGALLATWSIIESHFWLFTLASGLLGAHNAFWQYLRFAAAEVATDNFRPRAISYVLAGGVLAAVLGPQLAKWNIDLFAPHTFAGAYFMVCVLSAMTILFLQMIRIPKPAIRAFNSSGRCLRIIIMQPKFLIAVSSSAIGYGIMNFLMTSTPLAMQYCGFSFDKSVTVIQLHVVGMFLPSFITGTFINRFGVERVILCGVCILGLCIAVNLYDQKFFNFWLGLILLGIGWNFMFIGGTSLLTETYKLKERAKTQASHDFIVFGAVALTAFFSGALHEAFGWSFLNIAAIFPLILVFFASFWYCLSVKKISLAKFR